MEKSYNNGITLAEKLGWNLIHCVDENNNIKSIEDIHNEIMSIVNNFLSDK